MTKASEPFKPSDLTLWGLIALGAWGLAVLAMNSGGLLPRNVLSGLHASRLEGASLGQLRANIAALETRAAKLQQENALLTQRFSLNEQSGGDVMQRVGALELAVPKMLETLNAVATLPVDTTVTASAGTSETISFDVDGGSVSYKTTPLERPAALHEPQLQPIPEALTAIQPDPRAFGLALGPPIESAEGEVTWRNLNDKVGALLLGLGPLLANVEGGAGKRLLVGPVASEAEARQLCGRMARVGVACATLPFLGEPLPLLN